MRLSEIISPLVADGTRQCSESRTETNKDVVRFLPGLRLLVGSLYALLQIVLELEADEPESTNNLKLDLEIFDGCRELIDALRDFRPTDKPGDPDLDPGYGIIAEFYREEINYTILSADVSNLISLKLRLDLFGRRSIDDPWNHEAAELERPEVDTPVVCWWLNLLNADEANREPAEYHKEEAHRKRRRIVSPDYQIAVQDWPWYASRVWDATEEDCAVSKDSQEKKLSTWPSRYQSLKSLGYDRVDRTRGTIASQVLELFRPERKWNFVQWLLEFVETKVSPLDNSKYADRRELKAWTEELCQKSIPYLQVAAALGLSEVVEVLLKAEKGDQEPYITKTIPHPAICAMIGPIALLPGRFANMDEIEVCDWENTTSRRRTIELLTGPSRPKAEPWVYKTHEYLFGGEERRITVSQLLFQLAQQEMDPSIFYRLPDSHMDVDVQLIQLIADEIEETKPKHKAGKSDKEWVNEMVKDIATRHSQAKLLLMRVYDCILGNEDEKLHRNTLTHTSERESALDGALSDNSLRHDHGIKDSESREIPWLDTDQIHQRARAAMQANDEFAFSRYTADKRFDLAHPALESKEGTSLLHEMVGSDQDEFVRQLLSKDRGLAGTSINEKDSSGQTPMMLAESPRMLKLLIQEFGADTTITDDYGRNIWHLMAGSDAGDMAQVLDEFDPCKDENVVAVSKAGNTPLAMSFLFIKEWPAMWLQHKFGTGTSHKRPNNPVPEILTYCGDRPECFVSQIPLTHLVAEWTGGNREHNAEIELMIKGLQSVDLDFESLDSNGRSPLFHLSLNQSPQLIKKLCELCSGTPVVDNNNASLLTAVFENMFQRPITNKHTYEISTTPLPFLRAACPGALRSLLENSQISTSLSSSSPAGLVWDTVIKTFLSFAKKAIHLANTYDLSTVPEIEDISEAMLDPLLATLKAVLTDLIDFNTASLDASTDDSDKTTTTTNSIKQYEVTTGTSAFSPFAELTLSEGMEGYDPVWEVILPLSNPAPRRTYRASRFRTSETVGVEFFMKVKEIAMPKMDQDLLRAYFEGAGMLARTRETE